MRASVVLTTPCWPSKFTIVNSIPHSLATVFYGVPAIRRKPAECTTHQHHREPINVLIRTAYSHIPPYVVVTP